MNELTEIIRAILPYPNVDLIQPKRPVDGLVIPCPKACRKAFAKGQCSEHYQFLRDKGQVGKEYLCPKGFVTVPIAFGTAKLAVTSLVLTPRSLDRVQAERAKSDPQQKVQRSAFEATLGRMKAGEQVVQRLFADQVGLRMHPLHEVRRLNSTVKVIAERVCRNEAQNDPEQANPDLVRAWKATELISYQLDAMDIYANPEIVRAIPNTECSFYKLVDKVVRIYRPIATSKSKTLRLTGDSSAISWVNNHTIHVIPSVYIDNAVKYSPANGTIKVDVAEVTHDDKEHVQITVCSIGPYATPEEERLLFRRRVRAVRATNTADGTGLGLLLAQRVADQHHAFLWHRQQRVDVGLSEWEFGFRMLAKRNSSTRTRVRKRS